MMWRWCKAEITHPNLEVSHSDTMFDDKRWVRTLPSERVLIYENFFEE